MGCLLWQLNDIVIVVTRAEWEMAEYSSVMQLLQACSFSNCVS